MRSELMGQFDNFKFRCSSLGEIMSEPLTKAEKQKGELSATAKAHLSEIVGLVKHGRYFEDDTNATIKGTEVEYQGVKLYGELKGREFRQEKYRVENDYVTGEWDLIYFDFINSEIVRKISDIKCSYDYQSFIKNYYEPIKPIYKWQLQGYMWLSNSITSDLVHCLIDTPEWILNKEIAALERKVAPGLFEEKKEELIKNHKFTDIPAKERQIIRVVDRDNEMIERIPAKANQAREFMNMFLDRMNQK